MNWWIIDKVVYVVELGVALLIGCLLTLLVAVARLRRGSETPYLTQVSNFMKEKGSEAFIPVLALVISAPLGGLMLGGLVCVVIQSALGIDLGPAGRWYLASAAAVVVFICGLAYISRELFSEQHPTKPSGGGHTRGT